MRVVAVVGDGQWRGSSLVPLFNFLNMLVFGSAIPTAYVLLAVGSVEINQDLWLVDQISLWCGIRLIPSLLTSFLFRVGSLPFIFATVKSLTIHVYR